MENLNGEILNGNYLVLPKNKQYCYAGIAWIYCRLEADWRRDVSVLNNFTADWSVRGSEGMTQKVATGQPLQAIRRLPNTWNKG